MTLSDTLGTFVESLFGNTMNYMRYHEVAIMGSRGGLPGQKVCFKAEVRTMG